jgi:hypothetical protein
MGTFCKLLLIESSRGLKVGFQVNYNLPLKAGVLWTLAYSLNWPDLLLFKDHLEGRV